MQIYVKAIAKDSKLTWPSGNYILNYEKFNIKCIICDENLGFFKDKYKLNLKGTRENINSFISYLRMNGFKIEKY